MVNLTSQSTKQLSYSPSSIERKRVILAYGLLGIFVYVASREVSPYESYHIKWATWRWMLFVISMFVIIVPMLIIPFFWVLSVLIYIPLIGVRFYSVHQARKWFYIEDWEQSFLLFLNALWGWFYSIFEINLDSAEKLKKWDWLKINIVPSSVDSDIIQDVEQINSIQNNNANQIASVKLTQNDTSVDENHNPISNELSNPEENMQK